MGATAAAPALVQATAAAPTRQVTPSTPRHRVARLVIIGPLLCWLAYHVPLRSVVSGRLRTGERREVVILAQASGQASGQRRCDAHPSRGQPRAAGARSRPTPDVAGAMRG